MEESLRKPLGRTLKGIYKGTLTGIRKDIHKASLEGICNGYLKGNPLSWAMEKLGVPIKILSWAVEEPLRESARETLR